jgi:hypothetical protein
VLQQQRRAAPEIGGLPEGLALVRGVGRDVDQVLDVRITGGGIGDDSAAEGVADQHDWAGDGREEGT